MADDATKRFCKRYKAAKEKRERHNQIIEECYEYGMPLRERPYGTREGDPDLDRLYDATAPGAVQDLASEMLDDIWPTDAKPFELKAGRRVPEGERDEVDKALAEVTEEIVETINNSNFRHAAHQGLMDWAGPGTGIILPEAGDYLEPVRFRDLPLPEAITDVGPFDTVDALFRPRKVKAGDILTIWPKAVLDDRLATLSRDDPQKEVELVEGFERDWSNKGTETWTFRVVTGAGNEDKTLLEGKVSGPGSKPFVDFSYMRVHNESVGRGPMQLALPAIKSLNLLQQYILEAGDLAIGGMWAVDDDGVINPDTIVIEPRTIIPRSPGGKGIERLDTGADFRIGDFLVKELQAQVKGIMFGDDLGPAEGTPMSATEVLQRTSNRARRRAGPYSRLIVELLFQTVRRTAHLLVKAGRIVLPDIDGRTIVFRPLSPLTRAQAQDEILRHARFVEMGNALHGPQQMALKVDAMASIEWMARKFGEDPRILRSGVAMEQLATVIAGMEAMAAQQQQTAMAA